MARIDSPASKNRSACTGIRREAGGGLGRLWEDGPGPSPAARLDGEMGYGVGVFAGVVTPYGGVGLSGGGARGYRLGTRLVRGTGFELELEGERRAGRAEGAGHGPMLRGRMRWQAL